MELATSSTIAQGLFLKGIGLIYLIAFATLAFQVKGLFGSRGVAPINPKLTAYSVFRWNSSDDALVVATWFGIGASIMVVLGAFPVLFLAICWVIYYSFCTTTQTFLSFQWDALLLEVGFIAIFFAIQTPVPPLLLYSLWFVLFKLMFASGYTKLVFGNSYWRDLTAMDYHYETQPLPTVLGYYAHQQPKWFAKLSVIGVYVIELVLPFLIFIPGLTRFLVAVVFIMFQFAILLTGNFAFFNWLTIVLTLPMISNEYLWFLESMSQFTPVISPNLLSYVVLTLFAAVILIMNGLMIATLFVKLELPEKLGRIFNICRAFRVVNSYGLFVHMTTARDEIFIQGSDDLKNWKTYEFYWKPDKLTQRPKWVAPYQPRLDWQMWFASLSSFQQNPWFGQLLVRILQGSEDVLKLFKSNPFKGKPPKYIQAVVMRYKFTDVKRKDEKGEWWVRSDLRRYSPTISLKKDGE